MNVVVGGYGRGIFEEVGRDAGLFFLIVLVSNDDGGIDIIKTGTASQDILVFGLEPKLVADYWFG